MAKIKSFYIFSSVVFLVAFYLMYYGYFTSYTLLNLFFYFFLNAILLILLNVFFDLKNLLFVFFISAFIFPPQPDFGIWDSLFNFNKGFDFLLRYKDIFQFMILLLILLKSNRYQYRNPIKNSLSKEIKYLLFSLYFVFIIAFIGIVLNYSVYNSADSQDYAFVRMLIGTLGIFSSSVFVSIILINAMMKVRFTANDILFFHKIIFIGGLIISFEYIGSLFHVLPGIVQNKVFDGRGGFRGFLWTYPIYSGVVLFIASLSALYLFYYKNQKKKWFFFFSILFLFLNWRTLERSNFLANIIGFVIFLYFYNKKYRIVFKAILFLILTLIVTNNADIITSPIESLGKQLNYKGVKHGGYYDVNSTYTRIAIIYRAMDVFADYPVFGVGPTNLPDYMNNRGVSQRFDVFSSNEMTFEHYNDLLLGHTIRQQVHNYYINIIASYGLFGLYFIILFFYFIIKFLIKNYNLNKRKKDIDYVYLAALFFSFLVYYNFQPYPDYFWFLLFYFVIVKIKFDNLRLTS